MVKLAPVTCTRDEINAKYEKMNNGRKLLFGIEKAAILAPAIVTTHSVIKNENSNFKRATSSVIDTFAANGKNITDSVMSKIGNKSFLAKASTGFEKIVKASSKTKALSALALTTGALLIHNAIQNSKLKGRIAQAKDDSIALKTMFENNTFDVNKAK